MILPQAPGFDVKNQDQTSQDAGTNSAETHGTVQLLVIDPSLAHKESKAHSCLLSSEGAAHCAFKNLPHLLSKNIKD